MDNNESSLAAGRKQWLVNNLDKHISFILCDLSKEEKVNEVLGDAGRFDLVFGLHCCGGLAEMAVELALRSNQYSGAAVAFCVSTCCYLSNTHLASLTAYAASSLLPTPSREQHNDDVRKVTSLAVIAHGRGQGRAQRSLNALRLTAAEEKFRVGVEKTAAGGILVTWQEAFPVEYSVQNRVMVGKVVVKDAIDQPVFVV